MTKIDPITTQVVHHGLETLAEEMRTSLCRTALSVVVRDMLDYSCGLFDRRGRLMATALDLPTLIASMGFALDQVREKWGDDFEPGDIVITNDPYGGAAHTSDVHIFIPVFDDAGALIGFSGTIAHHADWGGRVPATTSAANHSVFEEGVRYTAVKLEEAGRPNRSVYEIIAANIRMPEISMGDLRAQIASARTGERGMKRLAERYGSELFMEAVDGLIAYTEERSRQAIAELPDGVYEAEGWLDDDGVERHVPVRLHAKVTISGSQVTVDLTGCAEQGAGGMNCPLATTRSSVIYALKCVLPDDIPFNHGFSVPVEMVTAPASIVEPRFPAATSDRHLTAQRLCDVLSLAFGQAAPERGSASWFVGWPFFVCQGTSPKTGKMIVGAANIGGGAGANRATDGASGIDVHGANCAIIPVEIAEINYPFRVERYELVKDSGGAGRTRGGLGIRADYRITAKDGVLIRSEAEQANPEFAPRGLDGGMPGTPSFIGVIKAGEGEPIQQDPKGEFSVEEGDVLVLVSGGGGGCGNPRDRDHAAVLSDLKIGWVGEEAANGVYGLDQAEIAAVLGD